jgi:hypothetical protein
MSGYVTFIQQGTGILPREVRQQKEIWGFQIGKEKEIFFYV